MFFNVSFYILVRPLKQMGMCLQADRFNENGRYINIPNKAPSICSKEDFCSKIFVPRFAKQNINSRHTSILVFEVGNATRPCYLPDTSKPADKDSSAETEQEWDA